MSKSRIGNNPLDALISSNGDATSAKQKSSPVSGSQPSAPQKGKKVRVTVLMDEQTADKARDLVFWTPGETMASFAERAIELAIAKEEKRRGEPFPPRKADLPKGRPVS